jgi:DNA-binding MarR family transcriptional regulator
MVALDRVLGENLNILAQLICDVAQPRSLAQASPDPLSRNQFAILKILSTQATYKVGELARLLDISGAATSKNVDRLQHLGLVERLAKPEDRRGLEVVLLPRGRAVVEAHARIVETWQDAQFGSFDPQEKLRLLDSLQRIIRITLAQDASPDMICLLCEGHGAATCAVRESKGVCRRAEGK